MYFCCLSFCTVVRKTLIILGANLGLNKDLTSEVTLGPWFKPRNVTSDLFLLTDGPTFLN